MARRRRRSTETPEAFVERLAGALAEGGYEAASVSAGEAHPELGRNMHKDRMGVGHWRLGVPHYWAVYIHQGYGPFLTRWEAGKDPLPGQTRRPKWLVWFDNPADDPRLMTGYPVRETDIVRLTKEQWRAVVRRIWAGDTTVHIANARSKPPGHPHVPGKPFFSNAPGGGMNAFYNEARQVAKQMTLDYLHSQLAGLNREEKVILAL